MNRIWLTLLVLAGLATGCSDPKPSPTAPINLDPAVKVVHAQTRTILRTVEQPGVIGAYERTAVYAKVSGFVVKWNVDIGDKVKKGATLIELTAPELVAQHRQMEAQIELDRAMVEQSQKQHLVAQRNVTAATELVAQARADVKRYEAAVDRWKSEVKRLTALVSERVVDQQVLDETRRQLKSADAALDASRVAVRTRDAQRLSVMATEERAKVDISAAEARVLVAIAEEHRQAALVGYLTIVAWHLRRLRLVARNVNTGDFVLPASGDPSQGSFSLGVAPSRSTPLYVFIRSDPMLFVVGVPRPTHPTSARGPGPACGCLSWRAARADGAGDLDLLGAQPHQPHPRDGPDRPAQSEGGFPSWHVRLRIGVHRAVQRPRLASDGRHADRQPDLLLPGGGRQGGADADTHRTSRRILDRGDGEARPVRWIARRNLGAVRRHRVCRGRQPVGAFGWDSGDR